MKITRITKDDKGEWQIVLTAIAGMPPAKTIKAPLMARLRFWWALKRMGL